MVGFLPVGKEIIGSPYINPRDSFLLQGVLGVFGLEPGVDIFGVFRGHDPGKGSWKDPEPYFVFLVDRR